MDMLHSVNNIPRFHKRAKEIILYHRSPDISPLLKRGVLHIKHNICYYSMIIIVMSLFEALSL